VPFPLNAATGTLTQNATRTIAAGAGAITLVADTIALGGAAGSIAGTGAITLRPDTASRPLRSVPRRRPTSPSTRPNSPRLADGFSSITIGAAAGTGGITVSAATFNDPVSLLSPAGGTINVTGTLTGAGNASITLDGSGATTVLAAGIVTADQDITISDSVEVAEAATVALDTGTAGGGNIVITGTTNGTAGGGAESLQFITGTGTTTLTGAVGGTTPLALTLQSNNAGNTGAVTFNGAVNALSLATFAHGYNVALNAGGTITADTNFLNTGTVTLGNDAGDALTFTGGLDTTGVTGGTSLAGTLATTATQMDLGAVTLTAASTLDTGGGNLALASLAGGAQNLTLAAGIAAGTTTVTGNVSNLGTGTGAALTVNNAVTGLVDFPGHGRRQLRPRRRRGHEPEIRRQRDPRRWRHRHEPRRQRDNSTASPSAASTACPSAR
jgi:hypothetical protein